MRCTHGTRLLASLLALVALLQGCAWSLAPVPATLEIPAGEADLGVEVCNGMLWVEVLIDGRGPFDFIVDTGAEITVLDTAVAREVYPKGIRSLFFMHARGAHGKPVSLDGSVRVRELLVGELVARDLDAIVIDLSRVGQALGRPFDGVIGYPVFRDALLVVDYPEGSALVRGRSPDDPGRGAPGTIPLLPGTEPQVAIEIAGRTRRFLVDTGAGTPISVKGLAAFESDGHPVVGLRRGVDTDVMSRATRLDGTVALGPLRYDRPIVHDAAYRNILGGPAFRDARITFDQVRRVLHVEPVTDEPIRMPPIHHLDVYFEKLPDVWVPARTLSGASIETLGFRADDRVVAIGGVPIEDLVCTPPSEVLAGRTTVDVTVIRDGATVTVALAVFRRLAYDPGPTSVIP